MEPFALVSTLVGGRVLSVAVAILTKRYLFGLAVVGFAIGGVLMLVASAFLTVGGWWQNVLIEVGTGLLFVGLIDLAILGALRRIIEPTERTFTVQRGDGAKVVFTGEADATSAIAWTFFQDPPSQDLAADLQSLTAAIQRLESRLNPPSPA